VLLLSALVGAGHVQAARAIMEALRAAAPDAQVELVDCMQLVPWWFRACYAGGFSLGMTRFRGIYGLGFWLLNRPHGAKRCFVERLRLWNERRTMKRLRAYLVEHRPDLIVNTHFLAPPVIAHTVRKGRLQSRQMVVVTDYCMHRWWYSEGVDHWFAPADFTAQRLRRWGIPEQRITVSGIPIHPKWTAPLDRQKVLADWRLPAGKRIVVLTGGTEFVCGPVVKIARGILTACPEAHLVVLAGRNKKLLEEVSALPEAGTRLSPVAFTDRAQELVGVCSLMVTKAGGITITECLAKGTPMVLLKPVPGQEKGNAKYLAGEGAAVLTRNAADAVAATARLLGDEQGLAKMADDARRLHRPGTPIIVDAILRAL